MVKGERFEKDGKTFEVVSVFGTNFSFVEVEAKKEEIPVVTEKPKKTGKKKG
ncbi:MAG: hypothetical protein IKV25_01205 [Clostridia bacterium]|nr:hypothetical protein [Bacteroidaceae bacterium]MBR4794791.1 hypothetical protein [Bacteroidaceae bacterium]MBR5245971.1 hypothetical protein [Clostridia bacterium]